MPKRKEPELKNGTLVVEVRREPTDGQWYSQVAKHGWLNRGSVVIDRQRGRGLDKTTIVHRANALAALLEIPFREYPEWECVALKKMACRCPKCCGA